MLHWQITWTCDMRHGTRDKGDMDHGPWDMRHIRGHIEAVRYDTAAVSRVPWSMVHVPAIGQVRGGLVRSGPAFGALASHCNRCTTTSAPRKGAKHGGGRIVAGDARKAGVTRRGARSKHRRPRKPLNYCRKRFLRETPRLPLNDTTPKRPQTP